MIYKDCRVYGPYKRKDNRQHVCIIYPDGKRSTVSYPKYLVELKLNRHLEENETIHHINGDFTDNRFENLQILDVLEHLKIHSNDRTPKDKEVTCYYCGNNFVIDGRKLKDRNCKRRNRNTPGYFCSKRCTGLYGKEIQMKFAAMPERSTEQT